MDIEWLSPSEDPPNTKLANHWPEETVDKLKNALRQRPGLWAKIDTSSKAARAVSLRKVIGPEYQVSQRTIVGTNGTKVYETYARRRPLPDDTRPTK